MKLAPRPRFEWKLKSRTLLLGERTRVMGIVNVTPDSFSDGGRYLAADRAIEHALRLLDEGADLLDIGGESTRPGSHAGGPGALSSDEEQARILPVIAGILRERPEAILSVDTYKASTAQAAIAEGAEIVNDVSGLEWDDAMAATLTALNCGCVLMHSRGLPDEWRTQASLPADEMYRVVEEGLRSTLARAGAIETQRIVLDPGYGFGKRMEQNYALLARQAELLSLGHPLLAGLSRKSFLARTAESERSAATLAASVAAILAGAAIVRVHEVRPMVEAAWVADSLLLPS